MMQNSPLLVTQTSPVKNSTPSVNEQSQQAPSKSFEQVLSKQVKQDENVSLLAKNNNTKATKDEGKKNVADITIDEPIDMIKGAQSFITIDEPVDIVTDAQSLAKEMTAKTLQDATDGEVVINAKQAAETLPIAPANIAPALQIAAQQVATNEVSTVEMKTLKQWKQPVTDINAKGVVDEKASGQLQAKPQLRANPELQADPQLQANPLKDVSGALNPKFANILATESKQQNFAEALTETSIKATSNIATVSLQTAVSTPAATLAPSSLQAGASNVINAFPGKTGWNEAVSQKIIWMVGATEQSATLTLNPKDLGPLQVIIQVNNEKADATFISENPEVRKALEEGMSSLRNSMGQAGVELGQANVNTSKQQQEFQQANKEQTTGQTTKNDALLAEDSLSGLSANRRVSNGLVDTFA